MFLLYIVLIFHFREMSAHHLGHNRIPTIGHGVDYKIITPTDDGW